MQTRRSTREHGLTLNMTPMIDVVFLLLIFFIVTAQFAQMDYEQPVELPEAESSERPEPRHRRLVVHVAADETWKISGASADLGAFEERLRRLRAEKESGEVEVRIRADRNVAYRAVEPLLLACARNGVFRVNFAVVPEVR